MIIGILSLQGCVTPHFPHFRALGAEVIEVKSDEDLERVDGLVLPGGESSTMWKVIDYYHLEDSLRKTLQIKPAWGICAGAILLANEVRGLTQKSFKMGNFDVIRNAYGRQIESSEVVIDNYNVCFIRAPKLFLDPASSKDIQILAKHEGEAVWIEWDHFMVTTFHPELNSETPSPMHGHFLHLVEKHQNEFLKEIHPILK